jgi:hypothetical protein
MQSPGRLPCSMSSLLVESPKKPLHCFGSLLPSGVLPLPEGRDASSRWGSAIELVERAPFLDEVRLQTTEADVLDEDSEDVPPHQWPRAS